MSERLQGEVDLLRLGVDVDQPELDDLTLLDEVLGLGDVAPAHVVDVQQAVEATQVDEGAEAGEALDLALDDVTDLDRVEELLLVLGDDLLEILPSVDDGLHLARTMELVDDEVVRLADQGLGILDPDDICLGEGAEALIVCSEVDLEAAFDHLAELAKHRIPVLGSLAEGLCALLRVSLPLRDDDLATLAFLVDDDDIDLVAELRQLDELVYRNLSLALVAHIDKNIVVI